MVAICGPYEVISLTPDGCNRVTVAWHHTGMIFFELYQKHVAIIETSAALAPINVVLGMCCH